MNILNDKQKVIATTLTRKLTLNGITKVYPVYKIRIDALYYNDQNDRIASWISQYKNENNISSLLELDRNNYNDIVERFIVASNPESIDKTQINIELVGQREPGVVLSDGRVIDGNRRFTCIRRLSKKNEEICWFEAVILDIDLHDNKKMIKMLELTIQHGEEKRIDYNQIEKYIGIYQDIIETQLLTEEEYALSTNEKLSDIKRKVEVAKIIVGYLDYIKMPKQYHIAREMQFVTLASDLFELSKRSFDYIQKEHIKNVVYLNILMNTFADSKKYIKNLALILSNNMFDEYYKKQAEIEKKVFERLNVQCPKSYNAIRSFSRMNYDLAEELEASLDYTLNSARKTELYNQPCKVVSKVISSLRSIDQNIVAKLPDIEVKIIKNQISQINRIMSSLETIVTPETVTKTITYEDSKPIDIFEPIYKQKTIDIIPSRYNDIVEIDNISENKIYNLLFKISLRLLFDNINNDYKVFFVDENREISSNIIEAKLTKEFQEFSFQLKSKMSEEKKCYMVIKKSNDADNEARFLIEYDISISFGGGFEF